MTSAVPFSRARDYRPDPVPGDAVYAPAGLMLGPGRSWDAEVRWAWAEIRIGGAWRLGRVVRWRLHQGSTVWAAYIRWGGGARDADWYIYDPATVRRAPQPPGGLAPWEVPPARTETT